MKVAEAILRYVRTAALAPGDRLPSERQMATQFSVGRNSVRAALKLLQEEGLIEIESGRGAFVCGTPADEGAFILRLMQINYRELLDIKMWLEQLAIRRASTRSNREQLDELMRLAQSLKDMYDQGTYCTERDVLFHRQLLACSGSSALSQLVLSLIDELNRYAQMLNGTALWLKAIPYHLDIARGLREGNLSLALAAHEYIYQFDIEALEELRMRQTEEQHG